MTGDSPRSSWKIDPYKASVGRVYDYVLGGKDNFAIDRMMAEKVKEVSPDAPLSAKSNKEFGKRVTRFMARQGIRQFIDLGSGIPTTPPSTHDTARAVSPDSTVVYVDNDPIVVAHSQALRDIGPGLVTFLADLGEPDTILDHPGLRELIDFGEPVGVLVFSVFQNIADTSTAHAIMRRFNAHMAPGSFLGLSHITTRSSPEAIAHFHKSSRATGYPQPAVRDDTEVLGFFDGFGLVDPGLVEVKDWRRDDDETVSPSLKLVGAVGRKA